MDESRKSDDLRLQSRTLEMVRQALARAQQHLFTRDDSRVCTFSIHPPASLGSWPVTLSRDRAVKVMAFLDLEVGREIREIDEAIMELSMVGDNE